MKSLLRSLLACALALPLAAQVVVEAKADKSALKKARAEATAAWEDQDWVDAATLYKKVVALDQKDGEAWHHLGYALHIQGQLDEALVAHMNATKSAQWAGIGFYNAACVHALQGRPDDAIHCLEQGVSAGFGDRAQIEGDSDFDSIRKDERFKKLLESLPNAPSATAARPYVVNTKRAGARLAFFSAAGSPGQLAIDYGQPVWKDSYAEMIDSDKMVGRRWRCGQDFWTTFDTNVPLTMGGQEIPAGAYYLTLEKKNADTIVLAFNDPAVIRKKHLDGFVAHLSTGGIEVPMSMKEVDDVAESLEFRFKTASKSDEAKLVLLFGPYALSSEIKIHFDQ